MVRVMSDYIKKEDAKKAATRAILDHTDWNYEIDSVPSVDVAPVRHGWWDTNEENRVVCSECKQGAPYMYKISDRLVMQDLTDYCPYCGAFMDKDGEEDE